MVTTATGAGGLNIRGSLDTSVIERGFTRVKQGFASVKGFAKGFTADLTRMSQSANDLSGKLIKVGGVGGAAMIGLASKAPAVAPALAKIGVTMDKLSRTLGEALAPSFEKVSNWLDRLAGWAGEHPDIFSGLVITLTTIAALKFVGATGFLTALGSLLIAPATLTALAYLATIGGVAFAGVKVAESVSENVRDFLTEKAANIPGTPQSVRGLEPAEDIAKRGFQPTPDGMISERDRRFFLLAWWDALWG